MAPRSVAVPSPQLTRTFDTLAPLVTLTVNVAVELAVIVAGGVIVSPERAAGVTVTDAVFDPTVAVTADSTVDVSVTVATPASLVVADAALSDPRDALNWTATFESGLPLASSTFADTVLVPPDDPSGVAVSRMRSAAAPPTLSVICVRAPPECARMVAAPDRPSPMNFTVTRPFCVCASAGSMRPIVDVKLTRVPLCTGVPAAGVVESVPLLAEPCSMSVAMMSTLPLAGTELAVAVRKITVPPGASRGALSQPEAATDTTSTHAKTEWRRSRNARRICSSIRDAKYLTSMYLQGQAAPRSSTETGFAMAALLVALAILSVVMLVALPTWRQQSQREKEIELIFRGEQYARAIALYQRKLAGTFPPSLDVLVEQKFLRKKYKDPITGDDFMPVYAGSTGVGELLDSAAAGRGARAGTEAGAPRQSGAAGPVGVQGRQSAGGRGSATPFGQVGPGGISGSPAGLQGATGIVGVVSKSNAQSIRIYNGRTRYDQWIFVYSAAGQQPQQPQQPATPAQTPRR